jgi:hypothetical protein
MDRLGRDGEITSNRPNPDGEREPGVRGRTLGRRGRTRNERNRERSGSDGSGGGRVVVDDADATTCVHEALDLLGKATVPQGNRAPTLGRTRTGGGIEHES